MELIKIYNGSLIDARELHTFLESKQHFANWITNRITRYGFIENEDYFTFNKIIKRENSKKQGASKSKEYHLTLDMAKELAMLENNDKGRQARKYFIEAEEALIKLKQNKRLEAFFELEMMKDKFKSSIIDIGGSENDYIQIDYKSRKVLFNGEPLEDEILHSVLLRGRSFALEMARANIKTKEINTVDDAESEAVTSHEEVRNTIIKNMGIKPEELPREENIKKLGE